MPVLLPHEVTNNSVGKFKGLHFFNSQKGFCCRQVRLALFLKGIEFVHHSVDIEHKQQHLLKEYLSINPRGLVPAIVHRGKVIVETVDILLYLDKTFSSEIRLIPGASHDKIVRHVENADTLHMYIRTLTLGRIPRSVQKSRARGAQIAIRQAIIREKEAGVEVATYGGIPESEAPGQSRDLQLKYWSYLRDKDFTKEEKSMASKKIFEEIFQFESKLESCQYLLGDEENDVLTLVDVVWWVIVGRFFNVLRDEKKEQFKKHAPNVWQWHERLKSKHEFRNEYDEDSALMKLVVGYNDFTENASNTTAFIVFLVTLLLLAFLIHYENSSSQEK